MKLSRNIEIIQNANDEQFLSWLMYFRYDLIQNYEKKIVLELINKRCNELGIVCEWGCCGTNKLWRKVDEQ